MPTACAILGPNDPMSDEIRPSTIEESRRDLQRARGSSSTLWTHFLELSLRLTHGEEALLLTRGAEGGDLRPLAQARREPGAATPPDRFLHFALLAERNGSAAGAGENGSREQFIATRVEPAAGKRALAVVRLGEVALVQRASALDRLEVAAAAVAVDQMGAELEAARGDVQVFAVILDLMVLLDEETHFTSAAMLLCNQAASRLQADRASLGWAHGHELRVEAISHADRFEKRSGAAKALAMAMEEAFDQDDEIVFPPREELKTVVRCHESYAEAHGAPHLASIPLRAGTERVGVLTLERPAGPFTDAELRSLRLTADHAARRLRELWQRDRWLGARLAHWSRQKIGGLIGPEHTGAKAAVVGFFLLLATLTFVTKTYRVEAPFTLRTTTAALLPAPFDGYLDQVQCRVGDSATEGQPLLALSTRELVLDESAALAEKNSFLAEAQKAQSSEQIAEMQIALAKAAQADTRLERTRYHLSQAVIKAPFDGIVIEGDLREHLGAPVKQGEVLVKIARLANLYPEAKVNERSIREVTAGAAGELAFASQPRWKFPIRVERVEPAAEVTDKGNNFTVKCTMEGARQDWWRPGMTGVCKIDAGRRSLLWLLTHRTVQYLRLQLWW